jgi:hypothetical protein
MNVMIAIPRPVSEGAVESELSCDQNTQAMNERMVRSASAFRNDSLDEERCFDLFLLTYGGFSRGYGILTRILPLHKIIGRRGGMRGRSKERKSGLGI